MNTNENTTNSPIQITATEAERPDFVKQIGKTTYKVKVHFSTTSKETMSDKIKRLLRYEVEQM
ncbi:MAG: transposon-encoded TnpW family protein [Oscillospiraceae bacterium]|nr:transposon-encoded TnpW family protein [Oscillospiraceae bacterium]